MLNSLFPTSEVLILTAICAVAGSIILSRYTAYTGSVTHVINFCLLLAGGVLANIVVAQFYAPLDFSLQRPMFISLGGMLFVAFVSLSIMSQGR
jgi:drug/metabolite transporter (DMT)-like permease